MTEDARSELTALCDGLAVALTAADTARQQLLEAILQEALAPCEEREAAA